ncbi:MAG: dihydroxy-acid dehydratase, partial [Steroidobacteraceae bacterium]
VDLRKREVNMRVPEAELGARRRALEAAHGYRFPPSQTPWQEIQRAMVEQLADGMVLKPAVKYQKIDETFGIPRDNH